MDLPSITAETRRFLEQEHQVLRAELLLRLEELHRIQREALLTSGAMWAWLATRSDATQLSLADASTIDRLVYLVPLALTGFYVSKHVLMGRAIKVIAGYLSMIEGVVGLPENFGWETHFQESVDSNFRYWPALYWISLGMGNAALAWSGWSRF